MGATALRDIAPSLTGAGFAFGQAEADFGAANTFEVNPSNVFQPSSIFTYVNDSGLTANGYPNAVGFNSAHADYVANTLYAGTTGPGAPAIPTGIAFGLNNIFNYSASYISSAVTGAVPVSAKIINQSFGYTEGDGSHLTVADQESIDFSYDQYVYQYGTIFVSASGATGVVTSPGTAYDSIGVGLYNGPSLTGPTADNGRSKPDISAPSNTTSISTAEVSGVVALIYQAALTNAGGAGTSSAATDVRTIKAFLLNGAVKEPGWSHTQTQPLDISQGAGVANAYNSYIQMAAGKQSGSVPTNTSVGGAHPGNATVNTSGRAGWDFNTLTTSSSTDAYRDYVVSVPTGLGVTGYDLTSTLVWNRGFNSSATNAINNLYLYLYDSTVGTTTPIDASVSAVDNVQQIYHQNLTPGHIYDIEVLKHGGALNTNLMPNQGVLTNSEAYGFAFSFLPDPLQSVWVMVGNGSWANTAAWANNTVPDGVGAVANLGAAVSGPFNVALDGNHTVGQLIFSSTNSYTLSPGTPTTSTLTLDWGANAAIINDATGNHTINAPLQLNSATTVNVSSSSNTLTINGSISGAGGLTQIGNGTVDLAGTNNYTGGTTISNGTLNVLTQGALPSGKAVANNATLNINASSTTGAVIGTGNLQIGANAVLQIASGSTTSTQGKLSIAATGLLNLNNNSLTLTYGTNPSPNSTVRGYIQNGFGSALVPWTGGNGITSSSALADSAHHSVAFADGADGVIQHLPAGISSAAPAGGALPAGNELITYAFAGDANLDGRVDFADFIILSNNFGTTRTNWDQGNFNYDGSVDFADFVILSNNFGDGVIAGTAFGATPGELAQYNMLASSFGISSSQIATWDARVAALPEPASVSIISFGAVALLKRRRRYNTFALI
ncbi:MAG: hypothetical protein M3O30_15425 [Planctomycetota bacterium]|nr:hypothetical protein [Planctomycetota bacterium]